MSSSFRLDDAQHHELIRLLTEARAFLVPLWLEWGERNARKVTPDGLGMCRFTSAFLLKVLGPGWRMAGGHDEAYDFSLRTFVPCEAGFKCDNGPNPWRSHFWIKRGRFIVDITASQFGAQDIVITTDSDPRYRANVGGSDLATAKADVQSTASRWFQLWQQRDTCAEPADSSNEHEPQRQRG